MFHDTYKVPKQKWVKTALLKRQDALREELAERMQVRLNLKKRELEILDGFKTVSEELVEIKRELARREKGGKRDITKHIL